MAEQEQKEKPECPTDESTIAIRKRKRAAIWAYAIGIIGIILTLAMALGIVFGLKYRRMRLDVIEKYNSKYALFNNLKMVPDFAYDYNKNHFLLAMSFNI